MANALGELALIPPAPPFEVRGNARIRAAVPLLLFHELLFHELIVVPWRSFLQREISQIAARHFVRLDMPA